MTETVRLSKSGFNDVAIRATGVSISFNNALRVQNKGSKKATQDTAAPITKITDKKKYAIKLVVKGVLSQDEDTPNMSPTDKVDTISSLNPSSLGMIFKQGSIRLYYRDHLYLGSIESLKIDDNAVRLEDSSGVQRYNIQFTFIYGTVK